MTHSTRMLLICASLIGLIACGGGEPAPAAEAPAAAPTPAPAPEPAKPEPAAPTANAAAAAKDRVEEPSFELALKPQGAYAAGKVGALALTLTPRGEYHVNQDYPFSVSLTGAGATFPKAELTKPDAAEFTEKTVRVDVPFTPTAAGAQTVSALVKFAVCTPETCVPDERTLALALVVE